MSVNRRDIVKAAALGGAALAAGGASAAPTASPAKVFWLKKPGSTAHRDQLVAGLRTLAKIPVVRSLQIGVPASTEQRGVVDGSFDVSELMIFDTIADEKIYQDHPIHREFIAKCEHLWGKVLVYDVMTV
jgi:hypothetical protein